MKEYLPIIQIIVSITLIVLVLLQRGETALGSAFGQGSSSYSTKRGIQKKVFIATIVFAVLFIILALLNLIL